MCKSFADFVSFYGPSLICCRLAHLVAQSCYVVPCRPNIDDDDDDTTTTTTTTNNNNNNDNNNDK